MQEKRWWTIDELEVKRKWISGHRVFVFLLSFLPSFRLAEE